MWTVGVIYGSSELDLTEQEAAEMDVATLAEKVEEVRTRFLEAGAHFVKEEMDYALSILEEAI